VAELVAGRNFNQIPFRRPLPPYREAEWERLAAVCEKIAGTAFTAHKEALAAASRGTHPGKGRWSRENVAWLLARTGPAGAEQTGQLTGCSSGTVRRRTGFQEVSADLFPALDVVIAYRLLFGIYSGIVPDGIEDLAVSDIDWAGDASVLLSYVKRRTSAESLNLPRRAVRLLEQWLDHSALLRGHAGPGDRERLWLGTSRPGGSAGMRVLVVEDSRSLADVLVEGLRDQGMAVDAAHDGLAAAAKLDLNSYDVVVLDRDLPGIHGDALCQMITDRDDRAMVLMLTAAGAPGDRVTGLALGADDYLGKPFHFPELVLRVRALARRQPSARARTLRAAGIELDPMRRTVTRDGRQLDLSVKEFGVLEALLVASPAFLRAEDLLEQVWDEQADPFTNTVTVTIGRLRRKLGDPPVIATRPGVGYRICDPPA